MKNRVIKFRAWHNVYKQMIDWQHLGMGAFNNEDYSMMQSTGLFDKNGKEIYEGDILKDFTEIHRNTIKDVVIFEHGMFTMDSQMITNDAKIVGNIHENPELLK